MLQEVTELIGLRVYTQKGVLLGVVADVLLDTTTKGAYELLLTDTNPTLVEESRNVAIPFRWVRSISDVVILKYFPGKVKLVPKEERIYRGRRKLRVPRRRYGEHGISRLPWR
jgi:sporulation protein YlmC with PRC-barrel domain